MTHDCTLALLLQIVTMKQLLFQIFSSYKFTSFIFCFGSLNVEIILPECLSLFKGVETNIHLNKGIAASLK